jgi:hypothetical protein
MLVDSQLPELELDARLTQQRLEETLASISPIMRAVMLLRLRDERSWQEIAAELRITDRQGCHALRTNSFVEQEGGGSRACYFVAQQIELADLGTINQRIRWT